MSTDKTVALPLPEAVRELYQEIDRPRVDVIRRCREIAKELRSWGVDEQRVDYDGEAGRSWLLVHLLDALDDAEAAAQQERARRKVWGHCGSCGGHEFVVVERCEDCGFEEAIERLQGDPVASHPPPTPEDR